MDNRPHSRKKVVSGLSHSVEKNSFSSQSKFVKTEPKRSGLSRGLGFSLPRSSKKTGKKTSIIDLIKLIVIIYIIYSIISSFLSKIDFSNNGNNSPVVDNNNNTNYVQDVTDNEVNEEVSDGARKKYTKILGNNQDDVTVMVYMIGTDLESGYGAATKDLNEMLYAEIEGNINIVIETGGCNRWNNSTISNKYIERYTINANGFSKLQGNIKPEAMTKPEVLSDFIRYSADNFPANRYMLILWDHGGGSVTGYGYDEKYTYAGSMSPDMIGKALKDGGVKFDLVGFDACLMANLETAIAIEPYADYLIGSEETEPGEGWYYTNWVKLLDDNTSIKTVSLGKQIIDDYISNSSKASELTQSITDLGELKYMLAKPLAVFSKAIGDKLDSNEYALIATARSKTKEFSKSSRLDQVDLVDLAKKFDIDGSDELIKAIQTSVKYNKSRNISNAYGLSAYFPYSSLSKMNQVVEIYDNIDMSEEYTNAIKSFATYASSGQIVTQNSNSSSTSIFDTLMGNDYSGDNYSSNDIFSLLFDSLSNGYGYNDYDYYGYGNEYGYGSYSDIFGGGSSWVDDSMFNGISSYLGRGNIVDTNSLKVVEKNGHKVVSLSEKQWELINDIELNVYVDDKEGYIDLGMDNIFEFNEDGDLLVEHDGSWLTLNHNFVSYYMVSDEYISDDNYKITGRIPAYLNDKKVDIMVCFSNDYPKGKVLGAKLIYEDSDTSQKGLIEIKDGDVINFICNYYAYDGSYDDEYQLGKTYIVDGPLELINDYMNNNYLYTYCFTDIYNNKLWTPRIES